MLDDAVVEKILTILCGRTSQLVEKASLLVDYMAERSEETQIAIMQLVIEKYDDPTVDRRLIGKSFKGQTMTDIEIEKLQTEYLDMVSGTIRAIIHTRKSSADAAKQLRDLVFSAEDFKTKYYILSAVMNDMAIPYVPIPESDGGEYENDTVAAIAERHWQQYRQLNCILRGRFGPTITSALILKVLSQVQPDDDRIGLFQLLLIQVNKLSVLW